MKHAALLIQPSQAGKEDILKIWSHWNKSIFRQGFGKNVNLRPAGHQFV